MFPYNFQSLMQSPFFQGQTDRSNYMGGAQVPAIMQALNTLRSRQMQNIGVPGTANPTPMPTRLEERRFSNPPEQPRTPAPINNGMRLMPGGQMIPMSYLQQGLIASDWAPESWSRNASGQWFYDDALQGG